MSLKEVLKSTTLTILISLLSSSCAHYELLKGKPLSVDRKREVDNTYTLLVNVNKKGKEVIGFAPGFSKRDIKDLTAILQYEIDDKDNNPIKLRGEYRGNLFEVYSFSIEGQKFDLRNKD